MPRLTFIKKYDIILKKKTFINNRGTKMGRARSCDFLTWLRPYRMLKEYFFQFNKKNILLIYVPILFSY